MTARALLLILLSFVVLASCGRGSQNQSRQVDLSSAEIPDDLTSVCGDPAILGIELDDIREGSCGIDDPVRVYFVSGVELRQSAVLNCETAKAFKSWVDTSAQPGAADVNRQIVRFRVASHYACRTRNSQPGARLSEHSKGNAIDIGGFTFANGEVVNVEDEWRSGEYSSMLRSIYGEACGIFGTTLGPDADAHHQDHMHFDVANYRSGAYCR